MSFVWLLFYSTAHQLIICRIGCIVEYLALKPYWCSERISLQSTKYVTLEKDKII